MKTLDVKTSRIRVKIVLRETNLVIGILENYKLEK